MVEVKPMTIVQANCKLVLNIDTGFSNCLESFSFLNKVSRNPLKKDHINLLYKFMGKRIAKSNAEPNPLPFIMEAKEHLETLKWSCPAIWIHR